MSMKYAAIAWVAVFVLAYIGGMQLRPATTEARTQRAAAGPGYPEPLPSFGPENAMVYVIEVLDFHCFYCAKRAGFIKRMAVEFKNVRFIEKHLPFLKDPGSEDAAVATLAAQRQGKMWRFRDNLLVHQKENWTREIFIRYAKELGLDVEQFTNDLDDPAIRRHIRLDKAAAQALSIRATPSLYINGRLVPLTARANEIRRMITQSENEVKELLRDGKAQTVAEARSMAAAKHHPAGQLFSKYYMDNDVQDLLAEN